MELGRAEYLRQFACSVGFVSACKDPGMVVFSVLVLCLHISHEDFFLSCRILFFFYSMRTGLCMFGLLLYLLLPYKELEA